INNNNNNKIVKKDKFKFEDVIISDYGFDLFMRHLVKEFCYENLLAFYEFEKFQELIFNDLSILNNCIQNNINLNNEFEANNFKNILIKQNQIKQKLIEFPNTLPIPYICSYSIEIKVKFKNEQLKLD